MNEWIRWLAQAGYGLDITTDPHPPCTPAELAAEYHRLDPQTSLEEWARRVTWIRHEEVARQNDHLHAAMATRRVIDQAIGLIMAQNLCDPDDAFNILRRAARDRNVRIDLLAADMIRKVSGTEPDLNPPWRG